MSMLKELRKRIPDVDKDDLLDLVGLESRRTTSDKQVPALAISSSDLRARVAAGLPIDYLTTEGVVAYVHKRGLYRSAA